MNFVWKIWTLLSRFFSNSRSLKYLYALKAKGNKEKKKEEKKSHNTRNVYFYTRLKNLLNLLQEQAFISVKSHMRRGVNFQKFSLFR